VLMSALEAVEASLQRELHAAEGGDVAGGGDDAEMPPPRCQAGRGGAAGGSGADAADGAGSRGPPAGLG
jgi:hypothetical protein